MSKCLLTIEMTPWAKSSLDNLDCASGMSNVSSSSMPMLAHEHDAAREQVVVIEEEPLPAVLHVGPSPVSPRSRKVIHRLWALLACLTVVMVFFTFLEVIHNQVNLPGPL
eukprot:TRINITY_DN5686_c0_g1_i1.p1 TRINITY_DN5686_c0_g1~~TRINITY_DN5686_c0_g1_i1.p1  ORF type:complete len:124 (+),score=13.68 TRINITY_DN5686_c0_g1_i1:45-374(+)